MNEIKHAVKSMDRKVLTKIAAIVGAEDSGVRGISDTHRMFENVSVTRGLYRCEHESTAIFYAVEEPQGNEKLAFSYSVY